MLDQKSGGRRDIGFGRGSASRFIADVMPRLAPISSS